MVVIFFILSLAAILFGEPRNLHHSVGRGKAPEPDVVLGHHLDHFFAEQMAMHDVFDPGLDAADHRRIVVSMGADIGIVVGGGLHRGAHFCLRIAHTLKRILQGGDTSTGHDLNLSGSLGYGPTGCLADLGRTISESHEAHFR